MSAIVVNLQNFVTYCRQHITGYERSEAQSFLDRFFRAFGHEGAIEAGAKYENRLTKGSAKGKIGFADLVWHARPGVPGVLIEMKSKGQDLSCHYAQLERYWIRITPNRPRYAVLCNFEEFWIFDFENQLDEPVDKIRLEQLPERTSAFSFMEVGGLKPVFENNQVEITDRTARRMGELYQLISKRGQENRFSDFNEEHLQRFILQCVLAMFAEDRHLLPRNLFVSLVQDCIKGRESTYDVLGGLFREMNCVGITSNGRYKGVDYFNGGLFAVIHPIELTVEELGLLLQCAKDDWKEIRPSIFGNIFEGAIDPAKRHAHGIHFTSEADIRQIVRPTISDYWEERIQAAGTIKELNALRMQLQSYRVLDPACGSGNFLYVAYQELKRIEKLLLDKLGNRRKSSNGQVEIGYVTPLQFYGMDTNPFAVQLARATMMIGRKIAIDKLGLDEPALPLNTLDNNIVCQDALFNPWAKADAIISNPPFLGGKHMRTNFGNDYIDRVFEQFSEVKDSVDYCCYWFRLAHDHIGEDGRAGFVGTNSISQGKSRTASLDYIVQKGGHIHEAISTQPWSGDANVHVSIVNWSKRLPKVLHLDNQRVLRINSALTSRINVSDAVQLSANSEKCFQGVIPVGKGFIVSEAIAKDWVMEDERNAEVLKPFSMGSNLAQVPSGRPQRWIIDFNDQSLENASGYKSLFKRVKAHVKPERDKNPRGTTRVNWWKFGEKRPAMRKALASLSCYFAVPEVSKWAIFVPCDRSWLPGNKVKAVASDDFYVLGILASKVHRVWMHAQKSTLKADIAYTHKTCFETFPFPQFLSANFVRHIRTATQSLHDYRVQQMTTQNWGITDLYNEYFDEPGSQLYKLHMALDRLVMQAYGFEPDDDILAKLLDLNLKLAEREQQGESVVGPWAPEDTEVLNENQGNLETDDLLARLR